MKATLTFTLPEISHLWSALEDGVFAGCYYGPRIQYWNRCLRIVGQLKPWVDKDRVERVEKLIGRYLKDARDNQPAAGDSNE